VVCNDFAIAGKPGRYISIENGPNAVSEPKISTVKKYRCLVIRNNYGCLSPVKDRLF
jgi:hypothetical protein